ncbi:MAG: hypothetical protein Q7T55_06660, partial [Solirubrobacteraceae bacterium]|nr:hypothetical protein [Solirubrobacteraceae bacterium]
IARYCARPRLSASFATPMSSPPSPTARPRQVLLFSGHRVDAPGREPPRFPPSLVAPAAAAIAAALDALGANHDDLALSQAASGGDLLFAEACVDRGVALQLWLPESEPKFIAASVLGSAGADDWRARYFALKARLVDAPQVLVPGAPDDPPSDPFERCNLQLLASALSHGATKLRFICLWDGAAGDGPGGTAPMVREVERHGVPVTWIDTRTLAAKYGKNAP